MINNIKEKSFVLNRLEIYDGLLGGLKLDFASDYKGKSNIFFSILIGENGSGKSIILRSIIDIFLQIESLKEGKIKRSSRIGIKDYELIYTLGQDQYKIISLNGKVKVFINEMEMNNYNEIKLPSNIMACSFLINDKFIWRKGETNSIYKYMGVRTSPTMTNTSFVVKQIVNNIIQSKDKKFFVEGMRECLKFLNLKFECKLIYKVKKKKLFFDGEIDESNIFSRFDELWAKRSTRAFGFKIVEELKKKPNELKEIVNLINYISYRVNNQKELSYCIDFSKNDIVIDNNININILDTLSRLDIISNPEIYISKSNSYSVANASSGEMHILFLITNILSKINENTLILIDEPEVSLHPNWQIKIISLLKKVLGNIYNSHLIIATHSHFMVSDLNKENSSVIAIKNEDNEIASKNIEYNTYGWSAENILYRVFDVPSNRNYYLADELDSILESISIGRINEVKDKMEKLEMLLPNLTDNDPLKEIINKILKKVRAYE